MVCAKKFVVLRDDAWEFDWQALAQRQSSHFTNDAAASTVSFYE
jgi:hypothetical protein